MHHSASRQFCSLPHRRSRLQWFHNTIASKGIREFPLEKNLKATAWPRVREVSDLGIQGSKWIPKKPEQLQVSNVPYCGPKIPTVVMRENAAIGP